MKIHKVDHLTREELEKECEFGWLFKKFIFDYFGDEQFDVLAAKFLQWMAEKGLIEEEEHETN